MTVEVLDSIRKESVTVNGKEYILPIIYEDNHMISIVKPIGLLSQSDGGEADDCISLIREYLRVKYSKPGNVFVGLVHRLDRNTGGTMVYAKTSKGASRLSLELREGRFKKVYIAITKGCPVPSKGLLKHKLKKNERENKVFLDDSGKISVLKYENIYEAGGNACVFASPITGRTHQIRAQFSFTGYPLSGDPKYGFDKQDKGKIRADRLCLWSSMVYVKHPVQDKMMLFVSRPEKGFSDTKYWFEHKCYNDDIVKGYLDKVSQEVTLKGDLDLWNL